MKTTSIIGFATDEKQDVTERVKAGLTIPFLNLEAAKEHAKLKRSYIYELLCFRYENNKIKYSFYGWAVPK